MYTRLPHTLSSKYNQLCVWGGRVGGWGDINKRKREGKMATQEVVNHLHTA